MEKTKKKMEEEERERTKVLMGQKAHTLKDAVFVVDGDGVGDDGNGGGEGSHVLEPLESGLKAHPLGLVQRQPQLSQHGSHPPPGCRCASEKRDCKGKRGGSGFWAASWRPNRWRMRAAEREDNYTADFANKINLTRKMKFFLSKNQKQFNIFLSYK